MDFQEAMPLKDLQESQRQVKLIGTSKILFIWHEDQVYAIQSQCPHMKLPLQNGQITKDLGIVCPFHKSEFDLTSGKVKCWSVWPPAIGTLLGKISKEKPLKVFPTKIVNDKIMIKIDV